MLTLAYSHRLLYTRAEHAAPRAQPHISGFFLLAPHVHTYHLELYGGGDDVDDTTSATGRSHRDSPVFSLK